MNTSNSDCVVIGIDPGLSGAIAILKDKPLGKKNIENLKSRGLIK